MMEKDDIRKTEILLIKYIIRGRKYYEDEKNESE